MPRAIVDSCVLNDLAAPDSEWFDWAASTLEELDRTTALAINPVIYSECSVPYQSLEEYEAFLLHLRMEYEEIPHDALFLAGKAFISYRKSGGRKINVLPDFFIGAHAAVRGYTLVTRDKKRFSSYFPTLKLVMPE